MWIGISRGLHLKIAQPLQNDVKHHGLIVDHNDQGSGLNVGGQMLSFPMRLERTESTASCSRFGSAEATSTCRPCASGAGSMRSAKATSARHSISRSRKSSQAESWSH